mgnify:CR=1 FL=1
MGKCTVFMVAAMACDEGERADTADMLSHRMEKILCSAVENLSGVDSTRKPMIYRLLCDDPSDSDAVANTHLAQLFREGFQYDRSASSLIRVTIERV